MAGVEIVAALARNRVIGAGGALPWRLPADLRRFKELTVGRSVIMGRRTFESIGRPLPRRRNIVVSRTLRNPLPGIEIVPSLRRALELTGGSAVVIGGARLYREALPLAAVLHLTHLDADFAGDTWFPEFQACGFECVRSERFHDAALNLDYAFKTWIRRPGGDSA